MASLPTVPDRKRKFIQHQKRILSARGSHSQRLYDIADRAGIPYNILSDVLGKVDQEIEKQSNIVYSRQMTDHVVEQIDKLYWDFGAAPIDVETNTTTEIEDEDDGTPYRHDDLALDKNIAKLPSTWDTSGELPTGGGDEDADQDAYIMAHARLQDLSSKRLTLQQKLNTYRTLVSLLEPYRNPKENVQPNLIYRDAPLSSELAKARTLAIRVAGRVGERYGDIRVPATAEDDEDMEMIDDENRNGKLNNILASW
ncbi:hypothetical protein CC78DRAFT_612159 [Lojkania enalia]|uniref:Kinetochore protein fta4 n=1 Tax=Lojkania enalia TaxID=147567 RepID=A0A9P4NAY7_9PLEO|nr:hypothetical protein CC78DRAFT_612159 [Didymosphaeria enalia]